MGCREWNDLIFPWGNAAPFRIGSGGGEPHFKGLIDDVRIYDRVLRREEVEALHVKKSVTQIVRQPSSRRTTQEKWKLKNAFLATAAPSSVLKARNRLYDARQNYKQFYDSIPTVMVMEDSKSYWDGKQFSVLEEPRQAYVLKRGAYDAPGKKVYPGVPTALPKFK